MSTPSRVQELQALATRLHQYAAAPALERHPDMQVDMRSAAEVVEDFSAFLTGAEDFRGLLSSMDALLHAMGASASQIIPKADSDRP